MESLVLGDGTPLALRPREPDGREGVLGWFSRLSPESRFRRFLSRAADVAIAVIDEVQRMGVGTALGSRLVQTRAG